MTARPLLRGILGAFLLWHVAAVTAYAVPVPVPRALRSITDPYVLLLGQWQTWNAFAPEPEERRWVYALETRAPGGADDAWKEVERFDPATLSPRRRPSYVKLSRDLSLLLPATEPVWERTLRRACVRLALPAGTAIRLQEVALFHYPPSVGYERAWNLHFDPDTRDSVYRTLATLSCPAPAA